MTLSKGHFVADTAKVCHDLDKRSYHRGDGHNACIVKNRFDALDNKAQWRLFENCFFELCFHRVRRCFPTYVNTGEYIITMHKKV